MQYIFKNSNIFLFFILLSLNSCGNTQNEIILEKATEQNISSVPKASNNTYNSQQYRSPSSSIFQKNTGNLTKKNTSPSVNLNVQHKNASKKKNSTPILQKSKKVLSPKASNNTYNSQQYRSPSSSIFQNNTGNLTKKNTSPSVNLNVQHQNASRFKNNSQNTKKNTVNLNVQHKNASKKKNSTPILQKSKKVLSPKASNNTYILKQASTPSINRSKKNSKNSKNTKIVPSANKSQSFRFSVNNEFPHGNTQGMQVLSKVYCDESLAIIAQSMKENIYNSNFMLMSYQTDGSNQIISISKDNLSVIKQGEKAPFGLDKLYNVVYLESFHFIYFGYYKDNTNTYLFAIDSMCKNQLDFIKDRMSIKKGSNIQGINIIVAKQPDYISCGLYAFETARIISKYSEEMKALLPLINNNKDKCDKITIEQIAKMQSKGKTKEMIKELLLLKNVEVLRARANVYNYILSKKYNIPEALLKAAQLQKKDFLLDNKNKSNLLSFLNIPEIIEDPRFRVSKEINSECINDQINNISFKKSKEMVFKLNPHINASFNNSNDNNFSTMIGAHIIIPVNDFEIKIDSKIRKHVIQNINTYNIQGYVQYYYNNKSLGLCLGYNNIHDTDHTNAFSGSLFHTWYSVDDDIKHIVALSGYTHKYQSAVNNTWMLYYDRESFFNRHEYQNCDYYCSFGTKVYLEHNTVILGILEQSGFNIGINPYMNFNLVLPMLTFQFNIAIKINLPISGN